MMYTILFILSFISIFFLPYFFILKGLKFSFYESLILSGVIGLLFLPLASFFLYPLTKSLSLSLGVITIIVLLGGIYAYHKNK